MAALADSNTPSASLSVYCSAPVYNLIASVNALTVNFKGHPRTVQAMALFDSVVLSSVKITIRQIMVPDSSDDYVRLFFRFGIVPRDTAFLDPASQASVLEYIPHLFDFATSSVPETMVVSFGENGVPFPPGLQLDLKAAEVRHKHPEALLGNCSTGTGANPLVHMKLEWVLKCSGEGFGEVY